MAIVLDGPIASDDPNDRLAFVTPANPFAVDSRVFRREDFRPFTPFFVNLVSPGRQQPDVHAHGCGSLHCEIDMAKVFVARFGWVVVREWSLPFAIGLNQSPKFSNRDGLNDI